MKPKPKQGEKYQVDWRDTFGYNGWYTEKEISDKIKAALIRIFRKRRREICRIGDEL